MTDPIPILLVILIRVILLGMYSNIIGIGHFILIRIGLCKFTVSVIQIQADIVFFGPPTHPKWDNTRFGLIPKVLSGPPTHLPK